jgi:hypothetical protein
MSSPSPSSHARSSSTSSPAHNGNAKLLNDYVRIGAIISTSQCVKPLLDLLQQLGDCLGKGAFGQVYRALFIYDFGLPEGL